MATNITLRSVMLSTTFDALRSGPFKIVALWDDHVEEFPLTSQMERGAVVTWKVVVPPQVAAVGYIVACDSQPLGGCYVSTRRTRDVGMRWVGLVVPPSDHQPRRSFAGTLSLVFSRPGILIDDALLATLAVSDAEEAAARKLMWTLLRLNRTELDRIDLLLSHGARALSGMPSVEWPVLSISDAVKDVQNALPSVPDSVPEVFVSILWITNADLAEIEGPLSVFISNAEKEVSYPTRNVLGSTIDFCDVEHVFRVEDRRDFLQIRLAVSDVERGVRRVVAQARLSLRSVVALNSCTRELPLVTTSGAMWGVMGVSIFSETLDCGVAQTTVARAYQSAMAEYCAAGVQLLHADRAVCDGLFNSRPPTPTPAAPVVSPRDSRASPSAVVTVGTHYVDFVNPHDIPHDTPCSIAVLNTRTNVAVRSAVGAMGFMPSAVAFTETLEVAEGDVIRVSLIPINAEERGALSCDVAVCGISKSGTRRLIPLVANATTPAARIAGLIAMTLTVTGPLEIPPHDAAYIDAYRARVRRVLCTCAPELLHREDVILHSTYDLEGYLLTFPTNDPLPRRLGVAVRGLRGLPSSPVGHDVSLSAGLTTQTTTLRDMRAPRDELWQFDVLDPEAPVSVVVKNLSSRKEHRCHLNLQSVPKAAGSAWVRLGDEEDDGQLLLYVDRRGLSPNADPATMGGSGTSPRTAMDGRASGEAPLLTDRSGGVPPLSEIGPATVGRSTGGTVEDVIITRPPSMDRDAGQTTLGPDEPLQSPQSERVAPIHFLRSGEVTATTTVLYEDSTLEPDEEVERESRRPRRRTIALTVEAMGLLSMADSQDLEVCVDVESWESPRRTMWVVGPSPIFRETVSLSARDASLQTIRFVGRSRSAGQESVMGEAVLSLARQYAGLPRHAVLPLVHNASKSNAQVVAYLYLTIRAAFGRARPDPGIATRDALYDDGRQEARLRHYIHSNAPSRMHLLDTLLGSVVREGVVPVMETLRRDFGVERTMLSLGLYVRGYRHGTAPNGPQSVALVVRGPCDDDMRTAATHTVNGVASLDSFFSMNVKDIHKDCLEFLVFDCTTPHHTVLGTASTPLRNVPRGTTRKRWLSVIRAPGTDAAAVVGRLHIGLLSHDFGAGESVVATQHAEASCRRSLTALMQRHAPAELHRVEEYVAEAGASGSSKLLYHLTEAHASPVGRPNLQVEVLEVISPQLRGLAPTLYVKVKASKEKYRTEKVSSLHPFFHTHRRFLFTLLQPVEREFLHVKLMDASGTLERCVGRAVIPLSTLQPFAPEDVVALLVDGVRQEDAVERGFVRLRLTSTVAPSKEPIARAALSDRGTWRTRLRNFLRTNDPARLHLVDVITAGSTDPEADMQAMTRRSKPEPHLKCLEVTVVGLRGMSHAHSTYQVGLLVGLDSASTSWANEEDLSVKINEAVKLWVIDTQIDDLNVCVRCDFGGDVTETGRAVISLRGLQRGARIAMDVPLVSRPGTRAAQVIGSCLLEVQPLDFGVDVAEAPQSQQLTRDHITNLFSKRAPEQLHLVWKLVGDHALEGSRLMVDLNAQYRDVPHDLLPLRITDLFARWVRILSLRSTAARLQLVVDKSVVFTSPLTAPSTLGDLSRTFRPMQEPIVSDASPGSTVQLQLLHEKTMVAWGDVAIHGFAPDRTTRRWIRLYNSQYQEVMRVEIHGHCRCAPPRAYSPHDDPQIDTVVDHCASLLTKFDAKSLHELDVLVSNHDGGMERLHDTLRRRYVPNCAASFVLSIVSIDGVSLRDVGSPSSQFLLVGSIGSSRACTAKGHWGSIAHGGDTLRFDLSPSDADGIVNLAVHECEEKKPPKCVGSVEIPLAPYVTSPPLLGQGPVVYAVPLLLQGGPEAPRVVVAAVHIAVVFPEAERGRLGRMIFKKPFHAEVDAPSYQSALQEATTALTARDPHALTTLHSDLFRQTVVGGGSRPRDRWRVPLASFVEASKRRHRAPGGGEEGRSAPVAAETTQIAVQASTQPDRPLSPQGRSLPASPIAAPVESDLIISSGPIPPSPLRRARLAVS